jgi:hypothetical protein
MLDNLCQINSKYADSSITYAKIRCYNIGTSCQCYNTFLALFMPLAAYFPVILTEVTQIATQFTLKKFITLSAGWHPDAPVHLLQGHAGRKPGDSIKKLYFSKNWLKSQSFEHLGWKSIAHIPSPNLAPVSSIDSNITGSDVSTKWHYYYASAKWCLTNWLSAKRHIAQLCFLLCYAGSAISNGREPKSCFWLSFQLYVRQLHNKNNAHDHF